MSKPIMLPLVAATLLAVFFYYDQRVLNEFRPQAEEAHAASEPMSVRTENRSFNNDHTAAVISPFERCVAWMRSAYQDRLDKQDRIGKLEAQLELRHRRKTFLAVCPGLTLEHFDDLVRNAFPEFSDRILQLFAKLDEYDSWLENSRLDLNDMSSSARKNALWTKREALFSDAASIIWRHELDDSASRDRSMQTYIDQLDENNALSLNERLQELESGIQQIYGGMPIGSEHHGVAVVSRVFFHMESVQQELGALEASARQQQINDMRRQMGFGEEQVLRLAERDARNEERWRVGYAYMAERERLYKKFDGSPSEESLHALRVQHFGGNADTIAKEEQQLGFFRFTRRRVYGQN